MSVRKYTILHGTKTWLPLVTLLSAAALQGCMEKADGNDTNTAEQPAAIPVEIVAVEQGDVAAVYSGTASIEADDQAAVVSQITGVVLQIHAEEGDFVEAGQLLVTVEADRYELEAERSRATLTRLAMEYQRKQELFARKLVSAEDFERTSAEYEAQKAEVGLADLNLRYTRITAPIAGYIAERLARVGNLVENHQTVFRVTSYDPLLAVLHVPERELGVLRKGLEVSAVLDALPGRVFGGAVTRISPVVDTATGTFRVTAELQDPDRLLKPGLFGRIDILYALRSDVPVIPRNAIVTEDEHSHVFVVADSGNAERRPVTLGFERDGVVEVLTGLVSGERVVTAGKGSLSDGTRVEVVGLPPVAARQTGA